MKVGLFSSLFRALASSILLLSTALVAVPTHAAISGTMILVGAGGYSLPPGQDLSTITSLDFSTNTIISSLNSTGNLGVSFGDIGSIRDLTFDTFSGPISDFINIDGWSFDLNSIMIGTPRHTLLLSLAGTGTLTGSLGSTYATWSFSTANMNAYSMTISAATEPAAVPVPVAIWLFGSGLIGIISLARRRWLPH